MPGPKTTPLSALLTLAHVRDYTLLTALAILGPYLAHILPGWDDSPLGARLIPVFYAPLLGVFWRQYGFTLVLALASPWINLLLFGMPPRAMAVVLSFELIAFTLLLLLAVRSWGRHAWMGVAAYLAIKPLSAILVGITQLLPATPLGYISQSVTTAWPGIVVLAIIGWLASRGPHQTAS